MSKQISIHALRGEGDFMCFEKIVSVMKSFQSTPSVGRATTKINVKVGTKNISIHALRGEGDTFLTR